ncbi:MAG: site-specific integrase, partial [Pseudomonadota bacterium]
MKCRSEELAAVTISKKEWLLEFAYPELGHRRLKDIEPIDVLGVLQTVERKGAYETTRRLRATIGAVFRYGVATARAPSDPTIALRGATIAPKVTHRAAIIEPKRFGDLLRAIDTFDGQPAIRSGLKMLALAFPRPGELRFAEWSEFDLDQKIWTIPAAKTKMGRDHLVPLSNQVIEVLGELRKSSGHHKLVLPSLHGGKTPVSENAFNLGLRRLGFGPDEMTSHGFRATASTLLNESGKWAEDAIERQLAHLD